MIKARKSTERGKANHGWLQSFHTFSFGAYHDPTQMGFSVLRVINEDRVAGSAGFPPHAHKDMEILTYVIEGALEHKDSLGTIATIKPGELQRMSAGTGVTHSEYNPLKNQTSHFLQIWILPDKTNYPPSYQQKDFSAKLATGSFVLVASNHGRDSTISLNQDVDMYVVKSSSAGERILNTDVLRSYWLQVVKGVVKMNEVSAGPGDSLQVVNESRLHFVWQAGAEFLLFDLA
jgi:redox-sensitive bicupin YhaK (pirin superfamily)